MNGTRLSLAVSLLAIAGCSTVPTTPTAPTTPSAATNAAATTSTSSLPNFAHVPPSYRLQSIEPLNALVVRYKEGHEASRHHQDQERSLALSRTFRFPVADERGRAALLASLKADPAVEFAEPDYRMYASSLPTDPYVAQQWDLPKIGLPAALDLTTGSGVVIADVDSGVDYLHPDLVGQVIKGQDFVNNDADPMDDNGHGTHTAGTMAALANNGVGVAGIASGAKVLAVKVLDSAGSGSTADIADGIVYAAQHGAKVINLSLGGPSQVQTLHAAIQQAAALDVLVVAAAGNDSASTSNYPAAYPEVLSVGATDANDQRATFSNYAPSVAIAAPGTNILSTYKSSYAYLQGTSMASPHVAAAAALVRAAHPSWTAAQTRQALTSTGDACTGFESIPGLKRLDVAKAVSSGGQATPVATPLPVVTPAPVATPVVTPNPLPVATPLPLPVATATPAATPRPTASLAPFTLTSVGVSGITASQATFRWLTSVPANTQLELVSPVTYLSSATTTLGTSHTATLSGFARATRYGYRVHSKDAAGRTMASAIGYFTTAAR